MDKLTQIKIPIINELEQFKNLFEDSLMSSNSLLNEVLTHIRQRNGKMMRPILVLLTAKLFGQVEASTLHAAVALELLHTASLVHDDVVDESSERRGQPSVNALFNNKVSVLVGDYLLATCLVEANLSNSREVVKVVSCLGQDLSEGEILQLANVSNSEISEQVYFDVIRKKTAALFAACTKAAALSVGTSAERVTIATRLGELIGICFQIKDDIFDYFDEAEVGKPTGNDMREGKLTLPAIFALRSAAGDNEYKLAARIKSGEANEAEISLFIEFVKQNGGIEYAVQTMHAYKLQAMELLDIFPSSDLRESLLLYLDYVVDRIK